MSKTKQELLEQQPCEDAVSRQMVLQCIKESREGIDWGQSEDEDAFLHYSATLYRTIASKECFPPVQPQPKTGEWILCDTQLPPKDKNVLVTRMYKGKPYVEIAEWNDGWTSYSDEYKVDYFTEHQVVAWMPLPKPYEESEDKE